nr:STAS domain-containing protein [uncultured Rhodoferax sp.]
MNAFRLPPELTIYAVESCHAELLAWLQDLEQQGGASDTPAVDGSQVLQIDAAGLQLLLSLRASVPSWELHAPSDVLKQACSDYGLQSLTTH